jgi:hypothetical protein
MLCRASAALRSTGAPIGNASRSTRSPDQLVWPPDSPDSPDPDEACNTRCTASSVLRFTGAPIGNASRTPRARSRPDRAPLARLARPRRGLQASLHSQLRIALHRRPDRKCVPLHALARSSSCGRSTRPTHPTPTRPATPAAQPAQHRASPAPRSEVRPARHALARPARGRASARVASADESCQIRSRPGARRSPMASERTSGAPRPSATSSRPRVPIGFRREQVTHYYIRCCTSDASDARVAAARRELSRSRLWRAPVARPARTVRCVFPRTRPLAEAGRELVQHAAALERGPCR